MARVGTIPNETHQSFSVSYDDLAAGYRVGGFTQNAKPPAQLRIANVKGELYMISGEGGNVAVYVTSEGVVLVDDMFDRNHADILAQVKSVTDKPLRYVLNTHQHDDHAGGDMKMLPIAEVVSHIAMRARISSISSSLTTKILPERRLDCRGSHSATSSPCIWAARKFAQSISAAVTPTAT